MAFSFVGNAPWIDFVNTRPMGPAGGPVERLPKLEDLLYWAQLRGLLEKGGDLSEADSTLFKRGVDLRALFREAADLIVGKKPVPTTTVEHINAVLAASPIVETLAPQGGGWCLNAQPTTTAAEAVLYRLASDFAHFLVAPHPALLRQCERADCVMFFLDTSKNHSRRWCSMDTCGNRQKASGRRARLNVRSPAKARQGA